MKKTYIVPRKHNFISCIMYKRFYSFSVQKRTASFSTESYLYTFMLSMSAVFVIFSYIFVYVYNYNFPLIVHIRIFVLCTSLKQMSRLSSTRVHANCTNEKKSSYCNKKKKTIFFKIFFSTATFTKPLRSANYYIIYNNFNLKHDDDTN